MAQYPGQGFYGYVAVGLVSFCWLLFVIGMGAPNWITDSTGNYYAGLWRYCLKNPATGNTVCQDVPDPCTSAATSTPKGKEGCDKTQTVRTFTVFTFITLTFLVATVIFYVFQSKLGRFLPAAVTSKTNDKKLSMILLVVTELFLMIAWAVFASSDIGAAKYDASFGLVVSVWVFLIFEAFFIWFAEVDGAAASSSSGSGASATASKPKEEPKKADA